VSAVAPLRWRRHESLLVVGLLLLCCEDLHLGLLCCLWCAEEDYGVAGGYAWRVRGAVESRGRIGAGIMLIKRQRDAEIHTRW
jgi:hypothetical protein